MPRVIKQRSIPITIEFEDGQSITAWVRKHLITMETAPEFDAKIRTAEIYELRVRSLEEQARQIGDADALTRIMDEIATLRPRANQFELAVDFACQLIERFEDYYLSEEDMAAGRPVEVNPVSLKQCDPQEFRYITEKINEKLMLTGDRGNGFSGHLQSGSTTPTPDLVPPTSTQSTQ